MRRGGEVVANMFDMPTVHDGRKEKEKKKKKKKRKRKKKSPRPASSHNTQQQPSKK
jgi:hypothetical protein